MFAAVYVLKIELSRRSILLTTATKQNELVDIPRAASHLFANRSFFLTFSSWTQAKEKFTAQIHGSLAI